MKRISIRFIGPLIGLSLFGLALYVLRNALQQYHYQDVMNQFSLIPNSYLLIALLFTALNYLVLTCYDVLALRYVKRSLEYSRIAMASFVSYAFSQNLGFGILTGGSLRYRLYSSWGLSGIEITNIVAFCAMTFWIGIFTVGGLVFTVQPFSVPSTLHLPFESVLPIGISFLLLSCGYVTWAIIGAKPLRVREWEFNKPSTQMALTQIAVAMIDWTLAGAVLFALLPPSSLSFVALLGIFLLAQVVGLISHVPGGLGIFEALVLYTLTPELSAASVFGALLAFRVIYYLVPLGIAIVVLGTHEFVSTTWGPKWVSRVFGQWVPELFPHLLAFAAFAAGAVLLFSGATPAVEYRLWWLNDILPLSVMEASHFLGSLAGAGLLFLAWGVQRRLDGAWLVTISLLMFGIVASLLKGGDYEEAVILGFMLAAFLPCRKLFYRRSSLLSERFTSGWLIASGVVIAGSIWIGFFSYKHVEYSNNLWWHFTLFEDAPRFLRASVGVVCLAVIVALARLLRPSSPEPTIPTARELNDARAVITGSAHTNANLALMGDKEFLFSPNRSAFIMYGIEGRSWVAFGDPVGTPDDYSDLVWEFSELCDRYGGWTVFYQVRPQNLHLYLDLGLTLQKLGEEARVPLTNFSLEGLKKTMRHSYRKVQNEGSVFDFVPASETVTLMPQLKVISDSWLAGKNTREKGFSLGYFNPEYLKNFPTGLVRKDGTILAFTNIMSGANKAELSVDLMRHLPDAPSGIMDFLFISLLLWGKDQGYQSFNLGMAPFSGLETRALSPLWSKMGSLLFRHGEHFYNFQGLRLYKEKFDPVWEPRYLASPGGLILPRILANVASLTSGGLKGVVVK